MCSARQSIRRVAKQKEILVEIKRGLTVIRRRLRAHGCAGAAAVGGAAPVLMPGGCSAPVAGTAATSALVKMELAMAAREAPAADVIDERAEEAPAAAPVVASAVSAAGGAVGAASGALLGSSS